MGMKQHGKFHRQIRIGRTGTGEEVDVIIDPGVPARLVVGDESVFMPSIPLAIIAGLNWVTGSMEWCAVTKTPETMVTNQEFVGEIP